MYCIQLVLTNVQSCVLVEMSRLLLHVCVLVVLGLHLSPSYAKLGICLGPTHHLDYDTNKQICCDGEVTSRLRDQDCCGGKKMYFTSLSICCNGNIEARYAPPKGSRLRSCSVNDEQCREQTCCGGETVSTEDTICCSDTTIYLNQTQQLERDFLQCCGGNLINMLSHFCCGGSAFPRSPDLGCCDHKTYYTKVQKCLTTFKPNRVIGKYRNICGKQEYEMTNQSCCMGNLHNIPEMDPANPLNRNPVLDCCDGLSYDNTKENCCRESYSGFPTHTIPKRQNVFCCGNGSYDANHQDCYNGKQLEKIAGKERCGYNYIDGVTEQCCSNAVYNVGSHKCCMGVKSSVIPKEQECCNGEGADETMLCCEGIVTAVKRRQTDDMCCYNYKTRKAETYDSKRNENCVEGRIVTLPPGAETCGISKYYMPEIQICCGEKVYNINDGWDSCCGDKPLRSSSQQCCNYKISNISTSDGSCCSKDFKVYRFDDNQNPCASYCGAEKYDDTDKICCDGVLHMYHKDTECCGVSAIRTFREGCCAGRFSWSRNGNTRCCGDRDLFNKKHAMCSNRKIIMRDPKVQKLSNTQYLCSRAAFKYFDGGVKYACESQNIFKGRLVKTQILDSEQNITHLRLSFADVTGLDRGTNFSTWTGPSNILLNIEVPKHDDVTCRKNYFAKYCRIIVLFNGTVKGGQIKIGKKAKFFMTSYSRKREGFITKSLSYEFCRNNFNVH